MRRGRPAPEDLHAGDALDFWRVEAYEPDRRLRLSSEMKLPGRAWLEFEVVAREGGATIRQTALFDPVGVLGLVYWYGVYPVHRLVFSGMLRGIARAATGRPAGTGEEHEGRSARGGESRAKVASLDNPGAPERVDHDEAPESGAQHGDGDADAGASRHS
jgi:hypothetical protein